MPARLARRGGRRPFRRRTDTTVTVQRVYSGAIYARVNTIGVGGIRPFVLVPGIGVSSTYFERLAPRLNEFGPVHALDLPGFGGVPHPGSAMTIRQYADLLGKVIDDLGLEDPIVVGHSMGTQVVADLASRRPELSTIVLIGPVVNPAERHVVTQARRFLQASWHEPFSVKVLAIGAYMFCGIKWFSRILPKMMHYPIENALPQIQAHTLVIRGEYDAVAPRDWVRRIGGLVPSARLWEIPGAAHSVMHKHAEEVARLCVEHARERASESDADGPTNALRTADTADTSGGAHPSGSAADVIAGLRGRLVETVGIIRHNDDLIEQGKTAHATALNAVEEAEAAESEERAEERTEDRAEDRTEARASDRE